MTEAKKNLYPAYLDLEGVSCLVVGGGVVAIRKIGPLLESGAKVTVVSPEAVEKIAEMAKAGKLDWLKRGYEIGEAAEYMLVVAATGNKDVNRKVGLDGLKAGRLMNVVDNPAMCNFIVPSTVKRGELHLALSTSGACPALTKKLRKKLENEYPETYGELLERLRDFRNRLLETVETEAERKQALEKVVYSEELERFIAGDRDPLLELLK